MPLSKASRHLYLYKPGYGFKHTSLTEISNTGRVELVGVATTSKSRRAAATKFETVVKPIVHCSVNALCFQDLSMAPAVIEREFEFADLSWHPLLVVHRGRVIENKVLKTSQSLNKHPPRTKKDSRKNKALIAKLTAMSQSPDYRARQRAAYSLGRVAVPKATELLTAALKDDHWQVREAAATSLGKLAAIDTAPALASALGDINVKVREAAGNALVNMGTIVSPVVIRVLSDPNPLARDRAARVLGKTGHAQAVAALIPLLYDLDAGVRKSTATALGCLNDQRATKPLLARLAVETERGSKSVVFKALEQIGDPAAVASMMQIFLDDLKGDGRLAGRVLMAIDPEGIQALAKGLKHTNRDIRAESAKLIGISGNRLGTMPLVAALKDKDIGVRRNIIEALGRIGDTKALAPLLDLWSHPSAYLRTLAADAVVRHGQPAVAPLLEHLKSKIPYYRWRAAWALGNLTEVVAPVMDHKRRSTGTKKKRVCDPEAITGLIDALDDPLAEVRWCVIRSLGALAATKALPALEAKLTDDDPGIRAAASDALALIRGQP